MYAPSPATAWPTRRRVVVSGVCASLVAAAVTATVVATSDSDDGGGGGDGTVDLSQRITRYTARFPVNSGYRAPSRAERAAVRGGVMDVLDGRTAAAARGLAEVGYTVRTLRLHGSDRRVAEIAESGDRDTGRGWGRIYVDLSRPVRWSLQVPHPRADMRSELMGAELFDAAPGAVMVLAGANRFAGQGDEADMAHQEDSAFNAVCTALVGRSMPAIQLHGFADASSPGHEVVLSPSVTRAGPEVHRAADLVEGSGLRTCRTWMQECGRLEGTKNVQGRAAAQHGLPFLHVENSRTVRDDPALRSRVVDSLRRVAQGWTGG